jgi:transcriptional regulator with XRE-family HTH domain
MEVGPRIEARIKELGITQSELARRISVSQTTINSLIRRPRRSSPHLLKIARALGTTAAYLVGETDDPDADAPDEAPLTSTQREILERFENMSEADQLALLQIARSMTERPTPPTVHSPQLGYQADTGNDDRPMPEGRKAGARGR